MVRKEQMEMDMSALDQSLDEVIASNRKKRSGGRGRGRGRGRGGKRSNSGRNSPQSQRNRSRVGKGGYRGRRGRGLRNNNNNRGPNRVNALNRNKQFKRRYPNNGRNQATQNRPRFGQKSPFRNGQSNSFTTTGKVLVTNLKSHVSSDDIKEIFEKFGTVTQAYVKFDAITGASTGTAEVIYARGVDARNAQQELDGAKIDEGVIRVSYAGSAASPRNQRRKGGRGRGRGKGQFNNPLQRQSKRMDMY